jgi:transposase
MDRKADGRRIYTPEVKREQLARLSRGEVTVSELSRELGISRSLLQRWKHLAQQATETAVASNEDVVPASELRAAHARIRELERALGRKTMEVEILQAARDEVKKKPHWYGASSSGRATP